MNQTEFDVVVKRVIERLELMLSDKRAEYATDNDVLSNLRRVGSMNNIQPEQALMVLVSKHLAALMKFNKEVVFGGQVRPLEQWDEKIIDIMAYMVLLEALVVERLKQEDRELDDQISEM